MDINYIKERVKQIELCRGDDESAHSMEDDLMAEFILYVSQLDGDLADMAKEVLKTQAIEFCRWCA